MRTFFFDGVQINTRAHVHLNMSWLQEATPRNQDTLMFLSQPKQTVKLSFAEH